MGSVVRSKELVDGGHKVVFVNHEGGRKRIILRGLGDFASLTLAEARGLLGALREFDNEGLLDD